MSRLAVSIIISAAFLLALVRGQQPSPATPAVVSPTQGERLSDSQGRTSSIKVSPAMGSRDLALWTTEIPPGSNIIVHRHDRTEEILFVHRGSGTLLLGDERVHVQEGSTIYVPMATYHGFENDTNEDTVIAFVATPPELVNFIRGMSWPAAGPPRRLTGEEIQVLEQRFDSIARPN